MSSVSEVLQRALRQIGQMEVTTATGGSTTTAIDTKLADRYGDDDLKDGTLFVIHDAGGAGAAPEGQFARISSYVESTNTITVDTALTVAIAAGDTLGVCKATYPLWLMIEVLNDALSSLGQIVLPDESSLVFAANTREYTWPLADMGQPPVRIQIQKTINVTGRNDWEDIYDWYVTPTAPGVAGKIVFRSDYPVGYKGRIWYQAEHPRVAAYNDVISETIHRELITLQTVVGALQWQNDRTAGTDEYLLQRLNKAMADLEKAQLAYPTWKAPPAPRILTPGSGGKIKDPRYTGTIKL